MADNREIERTRVGGVDGESAPAARSPKNRTTDNRAPKAGGPVERPPVRESAPAPAPATADLDRTELDKLVSGELYNPHAILGRHPTERGTVIRTLRPGATAVAVIAEGQRHPLKRLHEGGVWGAAIDEQIGDYQIEVTYPEGGGAGTWTVDDPYRWMPTLGDVDLHLIAEGRHERLWTVLGSHVRSYQTPHGQVTGTAFAVWAPNARGVRVTGDFTWWDGRSLPMRSLGSTGVWELFVPGVGMGAKYKFQILGRDGHWREKADPLAFAAEVPPATASIVHESSYDWRDSGWVERREATAWHAAPMSIYEVHLGSWRAGLSYTQLAEELTEYVTTNGFTHVEFLPVAEHPFAPSWGYQVTSYYAPTSRFGTPDEFKQLVDALHAAGIGVIVDWVPAHFPRDEWALARFDGTPLYEHGDPRRGEQPDWGTYVFDFGRAEVRNFLVANALYWLEEFHIDGLRVDAVASMLYLDYSRKEGEWVPNEFGGRENLDAVKFLQELNATVYRHHPGTAMVAEESTSWPGVSRPTHLGGLGFGFKWNMGWMHDTLEYVSKEPVHRQYHHHQMTFSMMYAWSENFVLPLSHDEVVHGKGSLLRKMPGDRWQQLANLRALYAYMWAHPGKQLLFMGGEFGQEAEWNSGHSLDWWLLDNPDHRGVQTLIADLNRVYKQSPALWEQDTSPAGFSWIDANDAANNVFSFVRFGAGGTAVACIANFSGVPHLGYRIGLPHPGRWAEIINTDSEVYLGSGVGNMGQVVADDKPWHAQPASAEIAVPPLGTLWLRYEG
ncbi:MAG: 1,4-alpha-glucan branching enzyme [Cryptosporangiaceae bacterium]|nr:1,4-alpha-glucan branching enzyme [Cryptosporangiaceae bacterium]